VGDRCGYLNSKGEIAIQPKFEFASIFVDGHAPIWDGESWRLIDTHGAYASPLKFATLSSFESSEVAGPLYPLAEAQTLEQFTKRLKRAKKERKSGYIADQDNEQGNSNE
jgi:hypothetical protein